jgi:DDE superfamily endonuclease
VGDDELGRAAKFRAALRQRSERYVLDVPCNTTMRDLEQRRPPREKAGVGRKRQVPFRRADVWAARQPESRWERVAVRDGEKGPLEVEAMIVSVRTKEDRRIGPEERLVVIRPVGEPRIDYALSNAGPEVPWRRWSGPSGNGTGSRRCSRRARARWGSITTRSAVGWAGTTT